jgi:lipopolysaccharide transport system permease protein
MTPVVYPASSIPERWRDLMVLANPMAAIVTSYQSIFYDHRLPAPQPLLAVGVFSVGLLWVSSVLFEARREEFAEYV